MANKSHVTDEYPRDVRPSDLEGCEIHPLFAKNAFRFANHARALSLVELSNPKYDFTDSLYNRMKPALRLATLFLNKSLPSLFRIYTAPIDETELDGPGSYIDRVLTLAYHPGYEEALYDFEHTFLAQMAETYRFTLLLTNDGADVPEAEIEPSCTVAMKHDEHRWHTPRFDCTYPQTALSTQWLWFLSRRDFDEMPSEEKYGKLFELSVTLIGGLAHAVWLERALANLFSVKWKCAEDGVLDLQELGPKFEPRFDPYLGHHPNLAHAVVNALFGGIPGLPNHGTLSTIHEKKEPRKSAKYRVEFSTLDKKGRVVNIDHITRNSIFRFFDPEDSMHRKPHKIEVELLEASEPLRRRLSTDLSTPHTSVKAPIVKILEPHKLQPVYTEFNEIARDDDGNLPAPTSNLFRFHKHRLGQLAPKNGKRSSRLPPSPPPSLPPTPPRKSSPSP